MSALGRGPSPLANAAIHVAYRANVDYLRNTGHSIDPTPPAGMADFLTITYSPAWEAFHAAEDQTNLDRYPRRRSLAEPGRLITSAA